MPPPPKSPSRLTGGIGRSPGPAERVQRAGDRDVVDVVPGGRRQRAVLAPAGHPRVDQPRVAPRRTPPVRTRAARPRPAGTPRPARRRPRPARSSRPMPVGVLEVEPDRPAAAGQRARRRGRGRDRRCRPGPPAARPRRGRPAPCSRTARAPGWQSRRPAPRPVGPSARLPRSISKAASVTSQRHTGICRTPVRVRPRGCSSRASVGHAATARRACAEQRRRAPGPGRRSGSPTGPG